MAGLLLWASTYIPMIQNESNRTHSLTTGALLEFPHPLKQTYLDQHLNRKAFTRHPNLRFWNYVSWWRKLQQYWGNISLPFLPVSTLFLWEWKHFNRQVALCYGFSERVRHNLEYDCSALSLTASPDVERARWWDSWKTGWWRMSLTFWTKPYAKDSSAVFLFCVNTNAAGETIFETVITIGRRLHVFTSQKIYWNNYIGV